MKFISLALAKEHGVAVKFFLSPFLSVRSLSYRPLQDQSRVIRLIFFLFLTLASILLAHTFLRPMSYLDTVLFSPAIYFFTEAVGASGQLLFWKTPSYPIHRRPLKAKSLSLFWGKEWNLWIQDWLKDVSDTVNSSAPITRMALIFFISGLFHELMVNFPYWLSHGRSYFGTMLGYFLIQAVALWIDKKWIKNRSLFWRRVYMWMVIILPSPLFINVPLLTFFGLADA